MRYVLTLILCLLAWPASAWNAKEMDKLVSQTNFIVGGGCSGTLISVKYRLVLTNWHCVESFYRFVEREEVSSSGIVRKVKREEREEMTVSQRSYVDGRDVGATSYKAVIVAHKQKSDLALLQIRATDLPYSLEVKVLPVDGQVYRGDEVWIVGNPAGLDGSVVVGNVSSLNRIEKFPWTDGAEVPYIQFAGGIWFGNSGGALLNEKGQLIGVPFYIRGTAHLGGAVHYKAVHEFLREQCYAELFDSKADSFALCDEKRKEAAKKKEKKDERE